MTQCFLYFIDDVTRVHLLDGAVDYVNANYVNVSWERERERERECGNVYISPDGYSQYRTNYSVHSYSRSYAKHLYRLLAGQ